MTPEELKKLEEAHKKAMEGINEFVKWMHDITETCNDYLGYKENK